MDFGAGVGPQGKGGVYQEYLPLPPVRELANQSVAVVVGPTGEKRERFTESKTIKREETIVWRQVKCHGVKLAKKRTPLCSLPTGRLLLLRTRASTEKVCNVGPVSASCILRRRSALETSSAVNALRRDTHSITTNKRQGHAITWYRQAPLDDAGQRGRCLLPAAVHVLLRYDRPLAETGRRCARTSPKMSSHGF